MPAPPSPLALCPAPSVEPGPALPLYQQIAQTLAQLIHSGAFKVGQRLPSVRATALAQGHTAGQVGPRVGLVRFGGSALNPIPDHPQACPFGSEK